MALSAEKPKTLGDVIANLVGGEQPTAVDVAMKLLDPTDVIMHTEINDPRTMNQLALMIRYCEESGDTEEAALWKAAYTARALHMVSYKRKRETVIAKMFASLQTWLMGQPSQGDGKLKVRNR